MNPDTQRLDPGFDPRVADWLEADPDRAPGEVLDTILAALPSVPQRRALRAPWRLETMFTPARAVLAAVFGVLLIGGALLISQRPNQSNVGGPSMSSTPIQTTPTPSRSTPSPTSRADELSVMFTSPLYGYSINVDPGWTVTAATVRIDDPASTEATAFDGIQVTGTDTTIAGAAEPLGSRSFSEYLAGQSSEVQKRELPTESKGGDPKSWPALTVGDQRGRVLLMCNYEVVFVQAADRVYQFAWGHRTFAAVSHMTLADFERVLETVRFPAAAMSPTPS